MNGRGGEEFGCLAGDARAKPRVVLTLALVVLNVRKGASARASRSARLAPARRPSRNSRPATAATSAPHLPSLVRHTHRRCSSYRSSKPHKRSLPKASPAGPKAPPKRPADPPYIHLRPIHPAVARAQQQQTSDLYQGQKARKWIRMALIGSEYRSSCAVVAIQVTRL